MFNRLLNLFRKQRLDHNRGTLIDEEWRFRVPPSLERCRMVMLVEDADRVGLHPNPSLCTKLGWARAETGEALGAKLVSFKDDCGVPNHCKWEWTKSNPHVNIIGMAWVNRDGELIHMCNLSKTVSKPGKGYAMWWGVDSKTAAVIAHSLHTLH